MNEPNIINYSEHIKEKFSFLEEQGFSYAMDDHHATYIKGGDSIELWFDFYCFEISCLLCKGKERLHLFNVISYFGYDSYGFFHMYHSYEQIPEVINQFAGYVRKLVVNKNIFDGNIFEQVYMDNENRRLSSRKRV